MWFSVSAAIFFTVIGSVAAPNYIYGFFSFVPLAGYVLIYRVLALRDRRTMECRYFSPDVAVTEQKAATTPGVTELSWSRAILLVISDMAVLVGLCMTPSTQTWALSIAAAMCLYLVNICTVSSYAQ